MLRLAGISFGGLGLLTQNTELPRHSLGSAQLLVHILSMGSCCISFPSPQFFLPTPLHAAAVPGDMPFKLVLGSSFCGQWPAASWSRRAARLPGDCPRCASSVPAWPGGSPGPSSVPQVRCRLRRSSGSRPSSREKRPVIVSRLFLVDGCRVSVSRHLERPLRPGLSGDGHCVAGGGVSCPSITGA